MSYRKNIFNITTETLGEIAKIDKKIADLKRDRSRYSDAFYRESLQKLRDERLAVIQNGEANAKKQLEAFETRVHEAFRMRPEQLTDDARLLQSGIKFSAVELDEMLGRYNNNPTMRRVISDYAESNGIRISSIRTEASALEAAKALQNYYRSAVSRPEYADIWENEERFNGLDAAAELAGVDNDV